MQDVKIKEPIPVIFEEAVSPLQAFTFIHPLHGTVPSLSPPHGPKCGLVALLCCVPFSKGGAPPPPRDFPRPKKVDEVPEEIASFSVPRWA